MTTLAAQPVVQVATFGLSTGAVFGLLALGLVLIYRTTGIMNFAHWAIGLLSAYRRAMGLVVNVEPVSLSNHLDVQARTTFGRWLLTLDLTTPPDVDGWESAFAFCEILDGRNGRVESAQQASRAFFETVCKASPQALCDRVRVLLATTIGERGAERVVRRACMWTELQGPAAAQTLLHGFAREQIADWLAEEMEALPAPRPSSAELKEWEPFVKTLPLAHPLRLYHLRWIGAWSELAAVLRIHAGIDVYRDFVQWAWNTLRTHPSWSVGSSGDTVWFGPHFSVPDDESRCLLLTLFDALPEGSSIGSSRGRFVGLLSRANGPNSVDSFAVDRWLWLFSYIRNFSREEEDDRQS